MEITKNKEFVSPLSRSAVIMRSVFWGSKSLKLVPDAPPSENWNFEIAVLINNFDDIGYSEQVPNWDFLLHSILIKCQ